MQFTRLLEILQRRLLNSGKKIDYFYVILLALIPIIFSYAIGIHQTLKQYKYTGYWQSFNWTSYVIMLPVGLYFLRFLADILFCFPTNRESLPRPISLMKVFRDIDVQTKIRDDLIKIALDIKIPFVVLLLDVIFHIGDLQGTIKQYIFYYLGRSIPPTEIQIHWSFFFN